MEFEMLETAVRARRDAGLESELELELGWVDWGRGRWEWRSS